MSFELLQIITWAETGLSGFIGAVALWKFSRRETYMRLLGMLLIVGCACNTLSLSFYYLKIGEYVNIPQSFYNIFSICIISALYYYAFGKRFARSFLVISVFYVTFFFVNLVLVQKTGINSYSKFLSSTIIIGYTVFYFYHLMIELPTLHLQRMPMFWINSGLLIYAAGSLFLFAFTDYLIRVLNDDMMRYWSFHNLLSMISNLIILIGVRYDLIKLRIVQT